MDNESVSQEAIDSYDPRDHPAQLVRRVHQRVAHMFTQAVVMPNLSVTQFVALVTLLKEGTVSQSRLGRLTSMDPSTTTVVVRKLEKDGLIKKTKSADDQRASVIELTPAGRDCAQVHIPISLKAKEDLLAPLTPIERSLFVELLRKVLSDCSDSQ
ncbi:MULTISPECIES: MarR family winged helix-turn-helix transcriptional regulator [Pacificibacter]|uniref:MarR family winged helix-turn-helix transcriptional regulator n=1 Tax=Pacificibacter TaxID=1042323 RepID=UPI001C0A266A|nr:MULTISPECIES: MarR family winged helix-turn-helix transcriptional regulator [Pacificibacter]MBU2937620.1 MarR family winged helix-turn-helix transcriptional regulator [Pacificibacter marinus]MDO6616915.1 MarR family winged helix-turn-helix transcriptional regulator [Pacificibacter sp. 1_MG-2023]